MNVFKRTTRTFLAIVGVATALITAAVALLIRLITSPPRLPLWSSPADLGLEGEQVSFPALEDGVRLSGWLVKSRREGKTRPTIVLVHDWGWNRLGAPGVGVGAGALRLTSVELLRLAHTLTEGGYHVLMFDLRNHGESAAAGSMTFGYREALDLLGALDFLQGRAEVGKIGVIGFGVGANATLYALTRLKKSQTVAAAVLVQPTDPYPYLMGLTRDVIGPLNQIVVPMANEIISWTDNPPPSAVNPRFAAAGAAAVPLLFTQEAADTWGAVDTVAAISQAAPGTVDLIVSTIGGHRYAGFVDVVDRPAAIQTFFDKQLT